MDRRQFFKKATASFAGFLVNPVVGVAGAIFAGAEPSSEADSSSEKLTLATISSSTPVRVALIEKDRSPFLQTRQPMNEKGEPFGGRVHSCVSMVRPAAMAERRVLVFSHDQSDDDLGFGLSVVEVEKQSGRWVHLVDSAMNRRFHRKTPVIVMGSQIGTDGKLAIRQSTSQGLNACTQLLVTPWQTVIGIEKFEGEDFGWIFELNPFTGQLFKLDSVGRGHWISFELEALPLKKVSLKIKTAEKTFHFESHQIFDPRVTNAYTSPLRSGGIALQNDDGSGDEIFSSVSGLSCDNAENSSVLFLG